MAEHGDPAFLELRAAFSALTREHQALERGSPRDFAAHKRHREHLQAYVDTLHRWRLAHGLNRPREAE